MTSTQRRLQPPLLGEVMRDLTQHGDIATAARLKEASGISAVPAKVEVVKEKREGVPRQPRKHPFAYLYINDRQMSEQSQRKKLEALVNAFRDKHADVNSLMVNSKMITVTLPGNHLVCALRVDSKGFKASRLAKYISSKSNRHNLAVYMRKPRKDVQKSKPSKHDKTER